MLTQLRTTPPPNKDSPTIQLGHPHNRINDDFIGTPNRAGNSSQNHSLGSVTGHLNPPAPLTPPPTHDASMPSLCLASFNNLKGRFPESGPSEFKPSTIDIQEIQDNGFSYDIYNSAAKHTSFKGEIKPDGSGSVTILEVEKEGIDEKADELVTHFLEDLHWTTIEIPSGAMNKDLEKKVAQKLQDKVNQANDPQQYDIKIGDESLDNYVQNLRDSSLSLY